MSTSRLDAFKKAKETRKAEKVEEEAKKDGSFYNFVQPDYTALEANKYSQVRVLGLPVDSRDKFSPKKIKIAWIIGDDGKWFKCQFGLDKEWILSRIIKTVMKYTWNKQTNTANYLHADSPLFPLVSKNNLVDNAYAKGWQPKETVVMNVIDRQQMDWHSKNKKTLLLSSKRSSKETDEGTKYSYNDGVPISVYNKLFDRVVSYSGDWEDYDIMVQKLKKDPWYEVMHTVKDEFRFIEDADKYIQNYSEAPLTEEERSWEMQDLDDLFKITTYNTLMNRLGSTIKKIDAEFGTTYHPELQELAMTEKSEKVNSEPAKKEVKEPSPDLPVPSEEAPKDEYEKAPFESPKKEEAPVAEAPKEEVAPPRTRTRERTPEPSNTDLKEQLIKLGFIGANKLEVEDVKLMKGIDFHGNIEWLTTDLVACGENGCTFPAPDEISCCVKCGTEF